MPSDLREQEIIIIDLARQDTIERPTGEKITPPGTNDWWFTAEYGFVDPRPRAMAHVHDDFDRITKHDGVFIIFADFRRKYDMIFGHLGYANRLDTEFKIPYDNWSFLSKLDSDYLQAESAYGTELYVEDITSPLGTMMRFYCSDAEYLCTLHPKWLKELSFPLATDKFGNAVAAAILPDKPKQNSYPKHESGLIFIFPHIRHKDRFLSDFLQNILPQLTPQLFPFVENQPWIHQPEYELPKVLELRHQVAITREQAEQHILELERQIQIQQEDYSYLYELLRGTGNNTC